MKKLFLMCLIAAIFGSCSNEKSLGHAVTEQINLKLPKDSAGNVLPISKATIGEVWQSYQPLFLSITGMVSLLPKVPGNWNENVAQFSTAASSAVNGMQPGTYQGIKSGSLRAIYQQIDRYILQVKNVFAIYLSSETNLLIDNIRAALNYIVFGDGVNANVIFNGIPQLK